MLAAVDVVFSDWLAAVFAPAAAAVGVLSTVYASVIAADAEVCLLMCLQLCFKRATN